MTFADQIIDKDRPESVRTQVSLPRRQQYYPSPHDWREEVLYFLLVDRFSDAQEDTRPLLDRTTRRQRDPTCPTAAWRWDRWAQSGGERWQGGTLRGVCSKLATCRPWG